jgi:hypothetical protein
VDVSSSIAASTDVAAKNNKMLSDHAVSDCVLEFGYVRESGRGKPDAKMGRYVSHGSGIVNIRFLKGQPRAFDLVRTTDLRVSVDASKKRPASAAGLDGPPDALAMALEAQAGEIEMIKVMSWEALVTLGSEKVHRDSFFINIAQDTECMRQYCNGEITLDPVAGAWFDRYIELEHDWNMGLAGENAESFVPPYAEGGGLGLW